MVTQQRQTISATIGRLEDGSDFELDLAAESHLGVQGASRSGKSVLTYLLLGGVAARSEVVVAGIDPTGILLNGFKYAPRPEWRHSLTENLDGAADVLNRVCIEMDERISGLLASSNDKIEFFTAARPLVAVVLEEYPGLLSSALADDEANGRKVGTRIEPIIRHKVRRLIQEGAKVGVRVILLAQRMSANAVGGDERSNIGTRISMRVDNADALRMLHGDVDDELVQQVRLFEPGVGLVERPGQPRTKFRADVTTYQKFMNQCRRAYPPPHATRSELEID